MARRATVAAILAALCAVVATVHAEPAAAYYNAITTESDWSIVDGWLRSQAVPSEIGTDAATATRWSRIKTASTVLGLDGLTATAGITLPTLAVTAGGLAFGWEIGHASGLSGWASGKLLGIGQPSPSGAITGGNWTNYTCSAGVNDFTPCQSHGYATGDKIWVLRAAGNPCATDYATTSWESAWNIDFTCSSSNNTLLLNWLQAVQATTTGSWAVTGDCTSSASTNDCYGVFFGFRELLANATVNELRAYNSTTDAQNKTATLASVPRPSAIAYGSSAQTALETAIENDDVLGPRIGTILHPSTSTGGDTSETVTLPQPRLNETYGQYRSRLRALGFLGTITLHENAGAEISTSFGPLVVTKVKVETGTTTTTLPLTSPWPDPPTTLSVPGTSTTVTVYYNPSTATAPAPGAPGSPQNPPPGDAPPPGGGGGTIQVGDCSCPAPDFSPITGVDYGDKFPFGVVSLVGGFLGTTMYASPDAPVFDFNFGWLGIAPHYVVDLDVMDSYMATIRTLLSFCIWIGGLWWFGSRWFGFSGSGDPGGAVDDVL